MPPAEPCTQGITSATRALVSVHDVMPQTLEKVRLILDLCAGINPGPVTLLVVPGLAWTAEGIEQLHAWQDQGHPLAGHGWVHHVERFGGLAHWLHGHVISGHVAEHLAMDAPGIAGLITRSHAWFQNQGLADPTLYVPPAWAMGPIPSSDLSTLPFIQYETLAGVYENTTGRLRPVPMVGYEAKEPGRAPLIRLWNRINRHRATKLGWLRIGIHPNDLDLPLVEDILEDLRRYDQWLPYSDLTSKLELSAPLSSP